MSKSAEFYKVCFEFANDAIFLVENGYFIECNQKTAELFGCTADQILNHTPVDFSPARQPGGLPSAQLAKKYIDLAYAGKPQRFQWLHQRLDGSLFYAEVSLTLVEIEQKKYLHAIVRDNTKDVEKSLELQHHRDHLEELVLERTAQLAENEQLLSKATKVARLGHWSVNLLTWGVFWSDETYEIFGLTKGVDVPGRELFYTLIHPDDLEMFSEAVKEIYQPGSSFSIDHRILRRDGQVCWVHDEAVNETNEAGTVSRVTGSVQDITDRKSKEAELIQARDEAERANRAKTEFLSSMSHELRTPMNAILGFSQILELENLEPDQKEFVQEIHHAGDHLIRLIDDLLDLSRIEHGKLKIEIDAVELKLVLDPAIQFIRPLLNKFRVSLNNQCDDLTRVLADPKRLCQVLINLLSNAAKYNRKDGNIIISCKAKTPGVIQLSVSDTGYGIAADQVAQMFTPFNRLGAELSGIEGTGIGLSLSKQIAELMNMKLDFESVPGKGSVFRLDIPLAENEITDIGDIKNHVPDIAALGQVTLIYIEDNLSNLRLLEALFRKFPNVNLVTVNNGKDGLDLIEHTKPDLIVLDLNLPKMGGYQILQEIKASTTSRNIPVIALSADAMPEHIERGLAAGFDEYMTKPLDMDSFFSTLEKLLKNYAG